MNKNRKDDIQEKIVDDSFEMMQLVPEIDGRDLWNVFDYRNVDGVWQGH